MWVKGSALAVPLGAGGAAVCCRAGAERGVWNRESGVANLLTAISAVA